MRATSAISDRPPKPTSRMGMGRGELILVADDSSWVRERIQAFLERDGFRVVAAADGREALVAFQERQSEVMAVITDLDMPNMDGLELVRELRVLSPQVAVMVITGSPDDFRLAEFREFAGVEILMKPFNVQDFCFYLKKVLPTAEDWQTK